jgi:hypothetical protein
MSYTKDYPGIPVQLRGGDTSEPECFLLHPLLDGVLIAAVWGWFLFCFVCNAAV